MTEDELAATWRDYKATGDVQLRNALVVEYLPLVRLVTLHVCRGMPPQIRFDDMLQVGALGLIDAVERYDPERLSHFEGWAKMTIRGDILNELATFHRRTHPDLMSDMERIPSRKRVSPELRLLMQDLCDSVAEHLKGLTKRERLVLFFLHFEELSLSETALRLGVSKFTVSEIHRFVILKLRRVFQVKDTKMCGTRRPRVWGRAYVFRRHERNPTGLPLGVHRERNKFRARVSLQGRMVHLGVYDTPEAASLAYQRAVGMA